MSAEFAVDVVAHHLSLDDVVDLVMLESCNRSCVSRSRHAAGSHGHERSRRGDLCNLLGRLDAVEDTHVDTGVLMDSR